MPTWIYFVHPPREHFVQTITDDEAAIMGGAHSEYLDQLFREGTLILGGPTFDAPINDGIAILEAPDRETAEAIMSADPAITSGLMTGELRQIRLAFHRSTD